MKNRSRFECTETRSDKRSTASAVGNDRRTARQKSRRQISRTRAGWHLAEGPSPPLLKRLHARRSAKVRPISTFFANRIALHRQRAQATNRGHLLRPEILRHKTHRSEPSRGVS